jgi:hypothetical protein
MPASFTSLMALTRQAAADLVGDRFVTLMGAVPADGDAGCGVNRMNAVAGDLITVDVIGTAIVEAGGAVADGALVQTDAEGRAVTKAAGATLGRALGAASGAGVKIEVLLIQS